jgi:hypothetical protein
MALWTTVASAKDIYIVQNTAGADTGSDCASAHSAAWFNSSANWGNGSTQIGPGTVVHLCGTFTGTANSSELVAQGNGVLGNPVTVRFETGANLTSPVWSASGAISLGAHSYITVDGGTNGIIQNTANGTALTYQQSSLGVFGTGNANIVQNLTISNMYQRIPNSSTDLNLYGSCVGLRGANSAISNNHCDHAATGVYWNFSGTGNDHARINGNTLTFVHVAIQVGNYADNGSGDDLEIYGNDITGAGTGWDGDTGTDHIHNAAVHLFLNQGSSTGNTLTNTLVYNNYIHGDFSCYETSDLFFEGPWTTAPTVFNNLMINGNTRGCGPTNAYITFKAVTGPKAYHNTVLVLSGAGPSTGVMFESGVTNGVNENNIFAGIGGGIYVDSTSTSGLAMNGNIYYFKGSQSFYYNSLIYGSLTSLKATCGCEASSITSNPALNSNGTLAGSPAIGLGANLTSLGITALDSDKLGVARPSSGAWDAGAYSSGSTAARPSAPTGLNIVVN